MGQILKTAGWLGTGLVAGVLIAASVQSLASKTQNAPIPTSEIQQLASVFEYIKNSYVEPVDEKKLIQDAIAGMVAGLDAHSQYFSEKEWNEFRESSSGSFVGVGIEIDVEDGLVKVITPFEDGPAYKAGLRAGDLITRVNATAVRGMPSSEVVKMIRGEKGTPVRLTIFRKDENRTFGVTIVREPIRSPSVKAKMVEPGYAWIRLSQFQDRSLDDFVNKFNELMQDNPKLKGLVLDLRNDPGGLLNAAVGVSAVFLPANVTVVSTNGQLEDSKVVYKTVAADYADYSGRVGLDPLKNLHPRAKTIPLVVLVNEGSASASEIVAGALKDYKRATVMGGQTYGKGSVQNVRQLGPNTGLKITTARYYLPKGETIQSIGVIPDIFVDDTAEGNPFALLRSRESDLKNRLKNAGEKDDDTPFDEAAEIAREEAIRKLEEEARKKTGERIIPEFGSEKDFPLRQALNYLQGKPVQASKTQKARIEEKAAKN